MQEQLAFSSSQFPTKQGTLKRINFQEISCESDDFR
jgi:hypothetical protein